MTTWAKMSKTKRCWMVYRAVRKLEPEASITAIQEEIKDEFGVKIAPAWILKRLAVFTSQIDRNIGRVVLREELILDREGLLVQHWRTTRAEQLDASASAVQQQIQPDIG